MVKNPPAVSETQVSSLGGEDPWRQKWQPTPVFLAREFHGQRSLAGYCPWGLRESDRTERLIFLFSSVQKLNYEPRQCNYTHLTSILMPPQGEKLVNKRKRRKSNTWKRKKKKAEEA